MTMPKSGTFWERLNKAPVQPEPEPPVVDQVVERQPPPCDHPASKHEYSHNYRARCQCGAVNVCGNWYYL